ncbi:MAG: PD40 domain-containing protein [Acidobacteria bacterium]|nr:PD40 domain-containing protein [Acidobacteriota bacterium]
MGPNGDEPRRLMSIENEYGIEGLKWSPDGRRLVYLKKNFTGSENSIETRSLNNDATSVLLARVGLLDFWWTSDGRLIYTQTAGAEQETYDLWELRMDASALRPTGEPHRLTRWVGYSPGFVSVSSDGKRIVTTKGYAQSDVYVAEMEANGKGLKAERRLTLDTRSDWPASWTQDGKGILFFSDRNGTFDIFTQAVTEQTVEPLVRGREDTRGPQISPDGRWLLYTIWPEAKSNSAVGPVRVMRVPQSGGPAELVLEAKGAFASGIHSTAGGTFPDFRCPSSINSLCVIAEPQQDEVLFTAFDPIQGRKTELARARIPATRLFWDLSRDGSRIAYGEFLWGGGDKVTIVTLSGGSTRELALKGWTNLNSVAWSAEGQSMFATTMRREGSALLRAGIDGSVDVLRDQEGRWFLNPRPSPDSRFLAFAISATDSNVWLIEDSPK